MTVHFDGFFWVSLVAAFLILQLSVHLVMVQIFCTLKYQTDVN